MNRTGLGNTALFLMPLIVCLLAFGCDTTRTHYGHTEAEWTEMTQEQQEKAKEEFERLVKSRQEDRRREQMEKDMQKTIGMGRGARGL